MPERGSQNAERLKWMLRRLKVLGWSRAQLARECRMSDSTIGLWLQGKRRPSWRLWAEVERVLKGAKS